MGLRVVVCVKPVPDPAQYAKVDIDPVRKTLVRTGIPTVLNPLDKHAIEAALQLRSAHGGIVRSISMAPPDVVATLREGLAMGVDEAYLLSDRAFAGSDTLATSNAICMGIRKAGKFDLVIAGTESADGGTAHVPSQIGEMLGVPHVTNVQRIRVLSEAVIAVERTIENGYAELEVDLPAVIAVNRKVNMPRPVSLAGVVTARGKPIHVWDAAHLSVDPKTVGLEGSPTQAGDIRTIDLQRKAQRLVGEPGEVAKEIVAVLKTAGFLTSS